MPHLILEHTPLDIDVPALLQELHAVFSRLPTINPLDVKTRNTTHHHWILPPTVTAFIHLDVCLLEGRSQALLKDIGDTLYGVLKKAIPRKDCNITLRLIEMPKTLYWKS
jgi:5-carboxymethyl-2-hydroxymuconate isomerase